MFSFIQIYFSDPSFEFYLIFFTYPRRKELKERLFGFLAFEENGTMDAFTLFQILCPRLYLLTEANEL